MKELSIEQIKKKIKKTNEKLLIFRSLMFTSIMIGIALWFGIPLFFIFGFSALTKSCLLVAMSQSLLATVFMLRMFKLDQKEEELYKELKLRELNEEKTKEYQTSLQNEKINIESKQKTETKNKGKEDSKDDNLTNGL